MSHFLRRHWTNAKQINQIFKMFRFSWFVLEALVEQLLFDMESIT